MSDQPLLTLRITPAAEKDLYVADDQAVTIVRVVHGARDVRAIF